MNLCAHVSFGMGILKMEEEPRLFGIRFVCLRRRGSEFAQLGEMELYLVTSVHLTAALSERLAMGSLATPP